MVRDDYSKPGPPRTELDQAWRDRLKDAEILLSRGRNAAAIASGLYALEIRLKVQVCERLELDSLPKPFETHHLRGLLTMSGLARKMEAEGDSEVKRNWDAIVLLSELNLNDLRYKPSGLWTKGQASEFLNQLRTPPSGVIPWLDTPSTKRRSAKSRKP